MREIGLRAIQSDYYMLTTDSNHEQLIYRNLVIRNLNINEPLRIWVVDISYIWTQKGAYIWREYRSNFS